MQGSRKSRGRVFGRHMGVAYLHRAAEKSHTTYYIAFSLFSPLSHPIGLRGSELRPDPRAVFLMSERLHRLSGSNDITLAGGNVGEHRCVT